MSFQKTTVPFSVTKSLSPLVADYLSQKETLKPFYSFYPDDAGFTKLIEQRQARTVNRPVLVDVLRKQNKSVSSASLRNIESLLQENTFTVTTGHQLNLFTGPLYFVYKIITTIKLSQTLQEKFPGKNFVPVYWMASEDHDIEEINHTFIYGKRVEWKEHGKGAAGRLSCNGIQSAIDELKTIIGESPETKQILSLLAQSYREANSLSEATRYLVNQLFGKYGLVVLDADNAALKKLFIPVMQDELLNGTSFKKVNDTISELAKNNYEAQVHSREINLFYLADNSRERIVKDGDEHKALNTSVAWNKDSLLKELNENPERFSPNVVLRPLYQETILPNIAYVGGPAEIAYWMQYKSMFEHYKAGFPALVLRNCALLLDEAAQEKMKKVGIDEGSIFKSADELAREFVMRNSNVFSMQDETAKIISAFDTLAEKTAAVDPSLRSSVEAEKQRQLNSLKSFEEKVVRAQKKKHETSVQQIQKLKEKLFPGGILQERHENFIPYFTKYVEAFFDELLHAFNHPEKNFLVLSE